METTIEGNLTITNITVRCEVCEKPVEEGDVLLSRVKKVGNYGATLGVQHLSCPGGRINS